MPSKIEYIHPLIMYNFKLTCQYHNWNIFDNLTTPGQTLHNFVAMNIQYYWLTITEIFHS